MNYHELKERIYSEIEKNKAELTALNDDIADHPEISGEEYETSKKIVKLLDKHGYHTCLLYTSYIMTYGDLADATND